MKNLKQLCSGDDCFMMIEKEDIVIRGDGTPHPASLKCHKCRTEEENKRLKNYLKHKRNKENKLKLNN